MAICDSEMLPCPVERGPGHQRFIKSEQILCFAGLGLLQTLSPWALWDWGPEDTQILWSSSRSSPPFARGSVPYEGE